jgi:hypothetical protein
MLRRPLRIRTACWRNRLEGAGLGQLADNLVCETVSHERRNVAVKVTNDEVAKQRSE